MSNLSDKETKLFIHNSLLVSMEEKELLRNFLTHCEGLHHSIIRDIDNDELIYTKATPAQKKFSLTDTAFQHFVEQKIADGFLYASLESFKALIEK